MHKEIKKSLLERKASLLEVLNNKSQSLRKRNNDGEDYADSASLEEQDDIDSMLDEVERIELANIINALARIDEGTYGVCEDCNKNIPVARLQALPHAARCINCQRDSEQNR